VQRHLDFTECNLSERGGPFMRCSENPHNAMNSRPLHHSITSSERSIIDGGMARPSAVAVLRFTTISNFVGNLSLSARSRKPASVAEFRDRAV
jgi:hypothetical protein